jgi:hypothetical protein
LGSSPTPTTFRSRSAAGSAHPPASSC